MSDLVLYHDNSYYPSVEAYGNPSPALSSLVSSIHRDRTELSIAEEVGLTRRHEADRRAEAIEHKWDAIRDIRIHQADCTRDIEMHRADRQFDIEIERTKQARILADRDVAVAQVGFAATAIAHGKSGGHITTNGVSTHFQTW